jgi:type I restriction enzyme S subunit
MWQGACGLASVSGVISPAYTVIACEPKDQFPEFWFRVFRTPWMKKMFERFSTGIASDRWRLYYKDFSAIKVRVPPSEYQKNVVKDLAILEAADRVAEDSVSKSRNLLKSLLNEHVMGMSNV